jgi:hypothetical protein
MNLNALERACRSPHLRRPAPWGKSILGAAQGSVQGDVQHAARFCFAMTVSPIGTPFALSLVVGCLADTGDGTCFDHAQRPSSGRTGLVGNNDGLAYRHSVRLELGRWVLG